MQVASEWTAMFSILAELGALGHHMFQETWLLILLDLAVERKGEKEEETRVRNLQFSLLVLDL